MNRHALHYLDLNSEPVDTREPSTLMIWAGAALAAFALWALTFVLFSL